MVEYVARRGTDSVKWDALDETFGADDLLPLWVADMDFKVDQHILDAIQAYLATGAIGYHRTPESYYEAFVDWERDRHGLEVQRDWIHFSPGVVAGFHMAMQALTEPGDAVIVNTPVYYPFLHAVESNGRELVKARLRNDCGRYTIDFGEFERLVVERDVKAYLLCSPHNPVGRVWTAGELERLLDICRAHGVVVVSDEIHQDLVFGDSVHTPTLSLTRPGDKVMLLTAASKTFNIAGLQNSFAVIPDEAQRAAWDDLADGLRLQAGNALGYVAVEAALRHGVPWLEEAKRAIYGNYRYLVDELRRALPRAVVSPLEGTYLAWADFGAYLEPDEVEPFMKDTCKLAFDYGQWFGDERDKRFVRINLATSRENIQEMLRRIVAGLQGR